MKKITWATHKSLFGQIATSTCLIGASAGIIFGVSAGTFKIEYMDMSSGEARLKAATEHNYFSQNIISQWNMFEKGNPGDKDYIPGVAQPTSNVVTDEWWEAVHPGTTRLDKKYNDVDPGEFDLEAPEGTLSETAKAARKKYAALVIDGATHTALDRSFNQGLYNGIANFNMNKKHDVTDNSEGLVYKPSQDSTQEFINIYRAVAAKARILSLAGFNHVTPLNALGERNEKGIYEFSDKNVANAGMMLMDGDISNNQNIASVLFRSDQPAFLSALAVCIYLYNNLHLYHDQFQDLRVAAFGGTAIPTVVIYMGGFQRGIEFFNHFVLKNSMLKGCWNQYIQGSDPSFYTEGTKYFIQTILPASKYKEEVEAVREMYKKEPTSPEFIKRRDKVLQDLYDEYSIKIIKLGDFNTHFSGSFAAGDAIGISKQFLNRGACAILPVAGPQSLDTAQEIMNQNSKAIVIGVDSAMERSDYQKPFKSSSYKDVSVAPDKTTPDQASNIIKFSAVKDMTNVSDKMLRLAASGKHWDVENTKPWLSAAILPKFTEEEVVKEDLLLYEPNFEKGTFDIVGINEKTRLINEHVLRLPLHKVFKDATHPETTLSLNKIYGFKAMNGTISGNLESVNTLCFGGEFDEHQIVSFGKDESEPIAFNYDGWDYTLGKVPGIRYFDFTNVPADKIGFSSTGNSGAIKSMIVSSDKSRVWQNGIIKFASNDSDSDKQLVYNGLLGKGAPATNWPISEPDPYSSICSFGFKTCGNIENGLISISADGWPLLFKALSLVNFVAGGSPEQPFMSCWMKYGHEYCKNHEDQLPEDFKNLFAEGMDASKFFTYDKKSPIYENYSHTMAILGYVLKNAFLSFDKEMTILLDDEGKPYLPTSDVPMSIIDWLKINMYLCL